MKKFWVCCFAALCVVLTGCAENQQKAQNSEPPSQADVRQEVQGAETEDSPQLEEQINPEEPDIVPEETALPDQFAGTWQDSETSQYEIEIRCEEEGGYTIEINGSPSSKENVVWQLTGTYDEIWGGIAYIGTKYEEITSGDGTVERKPVPEREEITGLIYFEDDGTLHWIDDFDHTGDDLSFEKE